MSQAPNSLIDLLCLQPGYEELAVFKILQRATHPTMGENLARSVIAHPSRPGRVYAEVSTMKEACHLAATIQELNRAVVRPVPRDELTEVLHVKSLPKSPQTWAKVWGKGPAWKPYKGDVGLLEQLGEKMVLLLVPRIAFVPAADKADRPAQMLALGPNVASAFGKEAVKEHADGSFSFKGRKYTGKGFLVVDIDDIEIIQAPETTPSVLELEFFLVNELLEQETFERAERAILKSRLKAGDRVKIISGDFRGIIGFVEEVREDEFVVDLPSQGLVETFFRSLVRAAFRIGDEVKVVEGPYKGVTGWVIEAVPDGLRVMNLEKSLEVCTGVSFFHLLSEPPTGQFSDDRSGILQS